MLVLCKHDHIPFLGFDFLSANGELGERFDFVLTGFFQKGFEIFSVKLSHLILAETLNPKCQSFDGPPTTNCPKVE